MRYVFLLLFTFSLQAQQLNAWQLKEKQNRKKLLPKSLKAYWDVKYAKYGEREVEMDIYEPKEKGTYPCIIYVHGGGWAKGTRHGSQGLSRDLALKNYVVANIDYRLSGEAKFPGAVEDVKAAVRYMRKHAKKYSLDPNKIFLIGGSAGGHLSAMAATTKPGQYEGQGGWQDVSSIVQACIIMGSGVDQYKRVLAAKNQRIENCVIFLGEFKGNEEKYKEASPLYHCSKDTPPILFLDGGKDKPGERYPDMIKKLNELKVHNEFKVIPDAKHGQWGKEPFRSQYVKAMAEFLKKYR